MEYVIWVEFTVPAQSRRQFIDLVTSNAATSVRLEPGCRRFDVLEPGDPNAAIALYEIYDTEAAFKDHLASAHFKEFDALSAPLVTAKSVRAYAVRQHTK